MRRAAAMAAAALALAAPARAASPHVLYMLHCQGCHLPDGTGSPGAAPSLRGEVARFLAVPGGREFLVQVPGSASAPIGDADLAAVLNWMVARFGPGELAAAAAPYTPEEVGRLRRAPLLDVAATRAVLIERIRRNP